MLSFLAIASVESSFSLMVWAPIFIHAALTCAQIAQDPSHVTGMYGTVINMAKPLLSKISDN